MKGIGRQEKENIPWINEVMGDLEVFKAKAGENHPIMLSVL